MLVVGLLNLFPVSAFSRESDRRTDRAEKIKAEIARLGTGFEAKIELKLYEGAKVKGYITGITADYVIVSDSKTALATEVPYSNIKQVRGNNLSRGVKIAIGVGIILLIGILVATQTR